MPSPIEAAEQRHREAAKLANAAEAADYEQLGYLTPHTLDLIEKARTAYYEWTEAMFNQML